MRDRALITMTRFLFLKQFSHQGITIMTQEVSIPHQVDLSTGLLECRQGRAAGFPQSNWYTKEEKAIRCVQDWRHWTFCFKTRTVPGTPLSCALMKEENTWDVSKGSSAQDCSPELQSVRRIYQYQTALQKKVIQVSQVTSRSSNAEYAWSALCFGDFFKYSLDHQLLGSFTQPSQPLSSLWVPLESVPWVSGRPLHRKVPVASLMLYACLFIVC